MDYPLEYLLEKFESAVVELVTGDGDARGRVCAAYGEFGHLDVERVPGPIRRDLRWIFYRLHKHDPRWDGDWRVAASTKRMQNRTAREIAGRIWRIYSTLKKSAQS
jgi:hypothetical protein